MSLPCEGCFSFTVECNPANWIATIEVQKSDPDVLVSNIVFQSSENAYTTRSAGCLAQPASPGNFWQMVENVVPGEEGWNCWLQPNFQVQSQAFNIPGANENPSGENPTLDTNLCTYEVDIAFADVILHPVSTWNCPEFTLLIGSDDPRVSFSPSSVLITNGFNSDIVLTLTLDAGTPNPQTITVLSDGSGLCVDPIGANFLVNTTPSLSVAP